MRIYLRRNGATSGEVIKCPDSVDELSAFASQTFDLESPVFYSSTGDLINSLAVLRDSDVVYVAKTGEMFFQSKAASRAKEFETFSNQKKRERESFFKPQSSNSARKNKKLKLDTTCKISVGFVEWRTYKRKARKNPKLVVRKQVGRQMTLSITVEKDASASSVLGKAVEAFKNIDPDIQDGQCFHLLYPDLQSEVNLLPGSCQEFTPQGYVELLNSYYSKVKLYIVKDVDWMAKKIYKTQYQPVESDSDSEQKTEKGKNANENRKDDEKEKDQACVRKDEEERNEDEDAGKNVKKEIDLKVDKDIDLEVYFKGSTPLQYKDIKESDTLQCEICKEKLKLQDKTANPIGCTCVFHQICLEEWRKTSEDGTIKCPVCQVLFSDVHSFDFVHEPFDYDDASVVTQLLDDTIPDQTDEEPLVEDYSYLHNWNSSTTQSVPSEGSTSPGYRFRQVYLRQFEVGSEVGTQDVQEQVQLGQDTNQSGGPADGLPAQNIASEVYIHRTRLKDDMLAIFKNENSNQLELFRVIDERGKIEEGEGVGVRRDIIATFWQQFFTSASLGDKEKVPCIRHDYQKPEWQAVARILVYGFKKAQYFPVSLSNAFLASCLFGEESISSDYLLKSFRFHITADERDVYDQVQKGESVEDDDLLDFLGNYKTYKVPNKDNVTTILSELAHQELIQRPRYIAQCWAPILCELKEHEPFQSPGSIAEFFTLKTPTTKKVVRCIESHPSNDAERQCLDFLKKFIRSLDPAALATFLKYTTGSDIMPDRLVVSFSPVDGLARRPISHTCGQHLELPHTYQSFSELAEEFTIILRDKGAWGFNIV